MSASVCVVDVDLVAFAMIDLLGVRLKELHNPDSKLQALLAAARMEGTPMLTMESESEVPSRSARDREGYSSDDLRIFF